MVGSVSNKVREEIAAANEKFMTTYKRSDATGVAALYTENGQVLPPDGDFVTGREALRKYWQAALDQGVKESRLEIIEVEGHGDTAIEVSRYTLIGEGGRVLGKGKYIVIWKRQAGQWKLHRDIFNSNTPAGA